MTSLELREKGYQVLVENLGQVATLRFLQEFGWGRGDYTKERETSIKQVTRETFWQDVATLRAKKNKQ
ncbi:MAG: hypothetical protein RSE13_14925 [Planktothrix sp. GU0601_MAG3]|nr:MAG: hypothetical protein RSE13_14925 [Planktothrix sp. GU0601_MAG3]